MTCEECNNYCSSRYSLVITRERPENIDTVYYWARVWSGMHGHGYFFASGSAVGNG